MEPKRTPKTPRTGERKPANQELVREMVKNWNNSRMTLSVATILTNKLDVAEMRELLEWFRYSNRDQANKIAQGRRF